MRRRALNERPEVAQQADLSFPKPRNIHERLRPGRRQGWTEVGVSLPQSPLHGRNRRDRQPIVRRLPPPSRDDTMVAEPAIGRNQPLYLPHADPQQLGRPPPHPPFRHLPDHMRPLELLGAHLQKVPVHRSPTPPSAKKGTSQFCTKGTSELGAYTAVATLDNSWCGSFSCEALARRR